MDPLHLKVNSEHLCIRAYDGSGLMQKPWQFLRYGKKNIKMVHMFNRPGVAGAVLQTPLLLINSVTHGL